jgi:hypothetical protein
VDDLTPMEEALLKLNESDIAEEAYRKNNPIIYHDEDWTDF